MGANTSMPQTLGEGEVKASTFPELSKDRPIIVSEGGPDDTESPESSTKGIEDFHFTGASDVDATSTHTCSPRLQVILPYSGSHLQSADQHSSLFSRSDAYPSDP